MKSYKTLKTKLDKVHSLFIRMKDADENGMVKCITCPEIKHYKEIDCGHFITRSRLTIRWDTRNTKPQCKGCNIFRNGEQYKFGLALEKEYGKGIVKQLQSLAIQRIKLSIADLQEIIEEREVELKEL